MDPAVADALSTELFGDEGLVLKVYDDVTGKPIGPGTLVKGNPTIGVGRNLSVRGIKTSEAKMMEANDMADAEAELTPVLPWLASVSAGRQVAVYSLYFNVALGNAQKFVAKWPNFLAQMAAGQYSDAAQNLRTSEPWASEVGPRAGRLADLVEFG